MIVPTFAPTPPTPAQVLFLSARGLVVPSTKDEAIVVIGTIKAAEASNPLPEVQARVEELFAAGYLQTSRAFCGVARLPEGKTGIEALLEAELARGQRRSRPEEARRWVHGLGEMHAARHYRGVWAEKYGHALTLDSNTFEVLRRYTKAQGVDFLWGVVGTVI